MRPRVRWIYRSDRTERRRLGDRGVPEPESQKGENMSDLELDRPDPRRGRGDG